MDDDYDGAALVTLPISDRKYGEAHVRDEEGNFLNGEYVRFTGTVPMEELLAKPSSPVPEPGGMTMAGF